MEFDHERQRRVVYFSTGVGARIRKNAASSRRVTDAPKAFTTATVSDVGRPCQERDREMLARACLNWRAGDNFRYLPRCFLQHRYGSILIRFNYLEQTQRFVVVEAAHTRSCLIARVSAGMAGHETGDSASDRPIFTLLHAGVGGCIEKPFGRYHWQYKDWCSPDDALRADDTETTQVEAVQATQGSSVISQSEATQVTLCKY